MLGKTNGGDLSKVLVLQNGEWQELTRKEDIERACHEENRVKFCQTNNTLAMQELLRL